MPQIDLSIEALRDVRFGAACDRAGWKMDATGREIIDAVTAVLPLEAGDYVAVPNTFAPPREADPSNRSGDFLVQKTHGKDHWRGRIVSLAGFAGRDTEPQMIALVARPWSGGQDPDAQPTVDVPLEALRFAT